MGSTLDDPSVTCNNPCMKSRTTSAKSPAPDQPKKTKLSAAEARKAAARERVRKHRAALRAQGLRPIQIWIPDTRRPGFAEEARRQSLAIARDKKHEKEIFDFNDAVME